jgi:hypothetical protein
VFRRGVLPPNLVPKIGPLGPNQLAITVPAPERAVVGTSEPENGDFRTHIKANPKQVAYATANVHATVPR